MQGTAFREGCFFFLGQVPELGQLGPQRKIAEGFVQFALDPVRNAPGLAFRAGYALHHEGRCIRPGVTQLQDAAQIGVVLDQDSVGDEAGQVVVAGGGNGLDARPAQQIQPMLAARGIVAGDHDLAAAQLRHPFRQAAIEPGAVGHRQGNGKGRALAKRAFHLDFTAHQAHQIMHDGQAKAAATETPTHAVVGLAEGRENVAQGLVADADARIAHQDLQLLPAIGCRCRLAGNANAAAGGKFDGVVDQIVDDLPQPVFVAEDVIGQRRIDVEPQRQPLLACRRGEGLGDLANHVAEVEG